MVDNASVLLWVFLFGTKFVTYPLTLVVAISQEKLNLPNTQSCLTHCCPLPKPERPSFFSVRVTWGSLGGDHSPLLPPKAGLNSNLGSYQSDEQCSPPLTGCCASPGSLYIWTFTPTHWEDEPLLQIKLSVGACSDLLLVVWRLHPSNKGGEKKITVSGIQD
jgi:hypothetical protein